MTEFGELFETAYEAPRCNTLHAGGRSWTDPEGVERSMKEWAGAGAVAVLRFEQGSEGPPTAEGDPCELWWTAEGELRTERQGGIEVRAGGMLRTFHPLVGAVERPEAPDQRRSIPLPLLARAVLEDLDFRKAGWMTTWVGASPEQRSASSCASRVSPALHR